MKQFNSEVEMIEYVVTKLDEQGCRSVTPSGECRYNGNNGTRCAAGWLMTDEELDYVKEGQIANYCGVDFNGHLAVVEILQATHDDRWDPVIGTFRSKLSESTYPAIVTWAATQKAATSD